MLRFGQTLIATRRRPKKRALSAVAWNRQQNRHQCCLRHPSHDRAEIFINIVVFKHGVNACRTDVAFSASQDVLSWKQASCPFSCPRLGMPSIAKHLAAQSRKSKSEGAQRFTAIKTPVAIRNVKPCPCAQHPVRTASATEVSKTPGRSAAFASATKSAIGLAPVNCLTPEPRVF